MSRKALIAVTIAWAVLVGGAFAVFMGVTTFGGDRLARSDDIGSRTEEYRWHGDPFILTDARSGKNATCVVRPDSGEQRPVDSRRTVRNNRIYEVTPWFTGSATMDCNRPVTLRSGKNLEMYEIMNNRIVMFGAAAVTVGPLAAVLVFGSRRKVNQ